jgi:heptaprenyl diphosphate synthase
MLITPNMTLLQDDNNRLSPSKRLTIDALLLSSALILSWLEAVLPFTIPLPGFKLGFANIATLLAVQLIGRADALYITLSRVFIISLLFGSVTGFIFSLAGGLLAFIMSAALRSTYGKISLIGISVAASAAHNIGQVLAACLVFTSISPLGMLWWLLLLSIPSGFLTGFAAEISLRRLGEIL